MGNPLYFLVGLLIASVYPTGSEPLRFADPSRGPRAALAAVAGFGLLSALLLRLGRHHPMLWRVTLRWAALAVYAVLVYVFHFPLFVWSLGLEGVPVLGTMATLSPLLALFGVLSVASIRADPVRRAALRDNLLFAFRTFLAFSLVPVLLVLGIDAGLERIEPLRRAAFLVPALGWGIGLGVMLGLVTLLPFLLRLAYGARPLPAGPLRERLEALCRSTDFRCRDLLVLGTGATRLANAFIVGLAGPLRFVFFTDAILTGMAPDLLESVLAHEIAHSKRRHLQCFLASMVGFGFVNAAGLEALEAAGLHPGLAALVVSGWAAFFWIGLFGWVSRRFETEADLAAAEWAPSRTRGMMDALVRVAELNRIPPWAWGWRHWSIERRVGLLFEAEKDPAMGEAFQRRCSRVRSVAAGFLLGALGLAGWMAARQASSSAEREPLWAAYARAERGGVLLKEKRPMEALVELRGAIAAGADGAQEWLWVADAERALGRDGEARKAEGEAIQKGLSDPRDRVRLSREKR